MAKAAFNALLVVMPYKPQTAEFTAFEAAVKNHSLTKYNFNFDKNREEVRAVIKTNSNSKRYRTTRTIYIILRCKSYLYMIVSNRCITILLDITILSLFMQKQ
jgi:hypothetical protein